MPTYGEVIMQTFYKIIIFVLLGCFFMLPLAVSAERSSCAHYSGYGYWTGESSSGEAMVADVLVARPVGLVTTVVGSVVYVVSLPFSLLGGNEKQVRQKLVVEPIKFTFKRPLGEFKKL